MKKNYYTAFIAAAVIPVIIFIALLLNRSRFDGSDTSEGESYLAALDKMDAVSVENGIREHATEQTSEADEPTEPPTNPADTDETTGEQVNPTDEFVHNPSCYVPYRVDAAAAEEAYGKLSSGSIGIRAFFSKSVFIGDSVMTGFSVYFGMSDNVNVYAEVGAVMERHLPAVMNSVISRNPEYIFIRYGLNEMVTDDYGVNVFMNVYKNYIKQLKEALPDTKIIILALSPVKENAVNEKPRLANVASYNEGFRKISEELGVGFYINSDLFYANSELYSKDGIHYSKELYEIWIKDIVKEMGIC